MELLDSLGDVLVEGLELGCAGSDVRFGPVLLCVLEGGGGVLAQVGQVGVGRLDLVAGVVGLLLEGSLDLLVLDFGLGLVLGRGAERLECRHGLLDFGGTALCAGLEGRSKGLKGESLGVVDGVELELGQAFRCRRQGRCRGGCGNGGKGQSEGCGTEVHGER